MQQFFATTSDTQRQINSLGLRTVVIASIALFLLILIASAAKHGTAQFKKLLFIMISFVVMVSSVVLGGAVIYLNSKANGHGPQIRTAGIEFWACGVQLEIRNPDRSVSNKIGTPQLHEHDDQLIHYDGVIIDSQREATLGSFIRAIGGSITPTNLQLPVAKQVVENSIDDDHVDPLGISRVEAFVGQDSNGGTVVDLEDGTSCDGQVVRLQAYAFKYDSATNTYDQRKLSDLDAYEFAEAESSPPGDCIIVTLDRPADKTSKRCASFVKDGIVERAEAGE